MFTKNWLIISLLSSSIGYSQSYQLRLKPGASDGKDAYIHDLNVNQNLGNHADYAAVAWTCSGAPCIARGLIDFNWSLVPAGANITSAKLKLFANASSSNGAISGNNESWIERITSPWDEQNVTWASQPSVSINNRVATISVPAGSGMYEYNVTSLVNDILADRTNSYGFRLSLQTEQYYRRVMYASSDHQDCSLHPELVIEYTLSQSSQQNNFLSLQPDAFQGKDAYIHDIYPNQNLGNNTDFASVAWTCNGTPCTAKSLIDFDLTTIPAHSEITEAKLYLYQNPASGNGPHSGNNASVLQRITSTWSEQTVTWATAPSVTAFNQVQIPQSSSSTENYILNVKELIQDYVNDPVNSFGFMISLVNETYYRRLTFASSDSPDCALRPKLEVTYKSPSLGTNEILQDRSINIFPNPSSGVINIETLQNAKYIVTDINGRSILSGSLIRDIDNTLDVSFLNEGIYLMHIELDDKIIIKKFLKK